MSTQGEAQFVSIKPQFTTFEAEGEFVQGYLVDLIYIDMKTGAVPKYTLNSSDGPISFLGTVQVVEALSRVKMGTLIKIIYLGETKTQGGFKVKDFDIMVALEEGGRMPLLDQKLDNFEAMMNQPSLLQEPEETPKGKNTKPAPVAGS